MRLALSGNRRIEASPGAIAVCPACGELVRPKCGEIVSWYWSHISKDCDPWSEPESEWHKNWKALFPMQWQECSIGSHRADVITPLGIIEFQKSFLQSNEIKERERFYRTMIWVVNALDWKITWGPSRKFFIWRRPRKTWFTAEKPIFMDIGSSHPYLYKIEDFSRWHGKTALYFEKVHKLKFINTFHGIKEFQPALPDVSSYDHYTAAIKRRLEIQKGLRQRSQSVYADLPLLAPLHGAFR